MVNYDQGSSVELVRHELYLIKKKVAMHTKSDIYIVYSLCDKVCQWLPAGPWFSPGTPVPSTNKTDRHDLHCNWLNIVLKVEL